MCTEQDGGTGVRGHRTINLPVLVVGTVLWALWESLKHHMLNICRPYIPRDESRFEFPPNRHLIPSFKTVISCISFWFFLCVILKITQSTSIVTNYNLEYKIIKQNKYFFQCYLVAAWFSHNLLTTLLSALSHSNLCYVYK
jgi:hypothetical protein